MVNKCDIKNCGHCADKSRSCLLFCCNTQPTTNEYSCPNCERCKHTAKCMTELDRNCSLCFHEGCSHNLNQY